MLIKSIDVTITIYVYHYINSVFIINNNDNKNINNNNNNNNNTTSNTPTSTPTSSTTPTANIISINNNSNSNHNIPTTTNNLGQVIPVNHHSQSPSPLHFNGNNVYVQQAQQPNYIASSPKHNHQNMASPVNYLGYPVGVGMIPNQTNNNNNNNQGGGSDSGSNSNLSYPPNFVSYITNPSVQQPTSMILKSHKNIQTEITTNQMLDSATAIETKNTKIDELIKEKDELTKELIQLKRDYEKQGFSFKKCLSVNKKLLIEKSTLEKKQARQKCMENRLRLGQFVTQRQGATFVENWVDGSAFNDIMKQQEIMNHAKEELDKERKLLAKKRPQLEKESGGSSSKSTKESKSAAISVSSGEKINKKIILFLFLF